MLRVFDFEMGNVKEKLCEMSWKTAREHNRLAIELANNKDTTPEQWIERTCQTVCDSMVRAGKDMNLAEKMDGTKCTVDWLIEEFGLRTINEMYKKILVESQLRLADEGEAKAA